MYIFCIIAVLTALRLHLQGAIMNVIDYLENDHHEVLNLIKKLQDTSPRAVKTREALFQQIRTELALHEIAEEKVLYPALKKENKSLILESYEEHHVVDRILEELAETPAADETWIAKLTVMRENLEHHIEEERKEVFKLAKKLFDKTSLQRMAAQMQEIKDDLKDKSPELIREAA
jgi:hemerythrin-like domain-containing protein